MLLNDNMKTFFVKYGIILVLLVGAFFRLNNLGGVPPQPTVDEVSIGYNAYSLIKTGADEYGYKTPILLRAYDDWRPALYVYLVLPFVHTFGLSVEAVRLPSVILSILTIFAVYLLVKELFKKDRNKDYIALITALLFSISPWDIYISRLGHEVNASFSFLIFGILFFLRFVNGNKWNLVLSSIFFALSFDSYQSTKIVVPILVVTFALLYFKKIFEDKKILIISLLLGILISLPMFITTFDTNSLIRFKGTNLLNHSESYFEPTIDRYAKDVEDNDLLGILFDNKKVASINLISHAYLSHLSPVWLFINENGEQFKAPGIGLLYLFELPLIVLGLLFLSRFNITRKNIIFIVVWGLVAIIPGAITTGYAHPMRIFNVLPLPQLFCALGIMFIYMCIKNIFWKKAYMVLMALVITLFSIWFFHSYFVLVPRELSRHFQYGVIKALDIAQQLDKQNNYDRVVVSNRDRLFESYMFYLYKNKYDPRKYQEMGGTVSGGFAEEHVIDNFTFGKIDDKIGQNTLYVINPNEFNDEEMILVEKINFLDGTDSLWIAEIK